MPGILDNVDQRTKLAGHNRFELLLFKLDGGQKYGINVFKVKEVVQCMSLTIIPQSNRVIRGVAHVRGSTIPIIDLSMAIGGKPAEDLSKCFVIISEYNQAVQGFLVSSVIKILNIQWSDIKAPPAGLRGHAASYLTAVTSADDELIEIIDVERVFSEICPFEEADVEEIVNQSEHSEYMKLRNEQLANTKEDEQGIIVCVDDSSVARNQIVRTLNGLQGFEIHACCSGKEAFNLLQDWKKNAREKIDRIKLIISDVEMPEMDGYTLTSSIRSDEVLKGLKIILHTSLSGVFNEALVSKVGADKFIAKFDAKQFTEAVLDMIVNGQ